MGEVGGLIADRYRVESVIGEGGMGRVLRVFDTRTESVLALKQLLVPDNEALRARTAALFRQEFHVLCHIAHPHVVRVFDYGVDGQTPYYTMEILEGQDLRSVALMPWQQVCELLRQLCSALSVVHARRFVHCDLTPRNVLLLADGSAKLIDFGAMAPVGEHRSTIGTPSYMAPEVVRGQALDTRADLFALGALAYFALTQRHAFPAASIVQLEHAWQIFPEPPSAIAPDVPPALDALVLSLLSLDPQARPINVAELSHRVSALLGRTLDRDEGLMRACLTAPSLTGRSETLKQLRTALRRAGTGSGGVHVLRGPAGIGRTRMLDALVLEAKAQAQLVLRVDARTLEPVPLACVRHVLERLRVELPTLTQVAAVLEELESTCATPAEGKPAATQTAAQVALLERTGDAILMASDVRPVLVVVDDLEQCDAESTQVLAYVAARTRKRPLTLGLSVRTPLDEAARQRLEGVLANATRIELAPLSLQETQQLLGSVFGDDAQRSAVADWIQRVSHGLPALCMQLAEHLVAQGHAVYEGRWKLPDELSALGLPQSLEAELQARLATLSPIASDLLNVLALVAERRLLQVADYLGLFEQRCTPGELFTALDELVALRLLTRVGDTYAFQQRELPDRLRACMPEALRRERSRRLAAHYATRGRELTIVRAYHHAQADQLDLAAAAIATLVETELRDAMREHFARDEAGVELYEKTLAYLKTQGASPARLYPLRKVLVQLASISDLHLVRYADETLEALRHDVGLDFWDDTDTAADETTRVVACLQRAGARFEATPVEARGLPAEIAIRELAMTVVAMSGPYATAYDVENVQRLPEMIRPLRTLAPVLAMVFDMVSTTAQEIVQSARLTSMHRRTVELTRQPMDGLDEVTRWGAHLIVSYYLGLDHANEAEHEALALADALVADALLLPLGLQIRRMHALMHGRYRQAEALRVERDQAAMLRTTGSHLLEMSLLREVEAADLCGDLLELGRAAMRVEARARKFPGWVPFARSTRARYHLLSEEPEKAKQLALETLAGIAPLSHGAWVSLCAVLVESLVQLGEHAEAVRVGQQALDEITRANIEAYGVDRLLCPLARALAAQRQVEEARALLAPRVAMRKAKAPDGVPLAALCESLCWIAVAAGDTAELARQLEHVTRVYRQGGHPGLIAKLERLQSALRDDGAVLQRGTTGRNTKRRIEANVVTRLQSELRGYSVLEQTQRLLQLVLDEVEADFGFMFRAGSDGTLRLLGHRNVAVPNPLVEARIGRFFAREATGCSDLDVTADLDEEDDQPGGGMSDERGRVYLPVWIRDPERQRLLAIVLVGCGSEQAPPSLSRPFVNAVARTLQAVLRDDTPGTSSVSG